MLTPRNANQFTIAHRMTATHERQGQQPLETIVRDDVLRLGPEGQLVGIVSRLSSALVRPTTLSSAEPGPALVILNAGVLHRVGPHRLHVTLARRIAAIGLASLRLDLGGIGDSIASSDAASFRESAVADTRAAMTGLGELVGARRFVLFGVCSGADNSIATALADDRVTGIILVDPPTYPTRRGQLRHLMRRITKRGSLRELARTALDVAARELRRSRCSATSSPGWSIAGSGSSRSTRGSTARDTMMQISCSSCSPPCAAGSIMGISRPRTTRSPSSPPRPSYSTR